MQKILTRKKRHEVQSSKLVLPARQLCGGSEVEGSKIQIKINSGNFSCCCLIPLLLVTYYLLLTTNISAIEIPLESFGKTTNIAYVDMHKIFEAFPETEQARVELNNLIEEKKIEITAKKEEIAKLKSEIDLLRKKVFDVLPSTNSTNVLSESTTTEQTPQSATGLAPKPLTPLTLPKGSPLGFIFSPPTESTRTVSVEKSTVPTVMISTIAPRILPEILSPEPQLREKETLLTQREADLEFFIEAAEDEVRKLEEGKTMTLMARIYKGLGEIAAKGGYSVIIDKENILYGEVAVDITQDMISKLSTLKLKEKLK